jgi:hypothetical protein
VLAATAIVVAAGTAAASAGPRVPPEFSPLSFTAVSDSHYWLLGLVRCGSSRCWSIARTTDGGRSFAAVPAPPLPVSGTTPYLRFADTRDGFAFVPGVGGAFYATHDGGATWRRLRFGTVFGFATGGGNVYLLTGRCTQQRCVDYRFRRARVSAGAWTATPLPFTPEGPVADLAAHGADVWLLATPAAGPYGRHDLLARSRDGGRSFVTGPGPCYPGLGGTVAPTSPGVLWAVCPTGMLAGASRSTDGGISFARLHTPPLVNSTQLAAASDDTAVLAGNGAGSRLVRTIDGGSTWHRVRTPGRVVFAPFIGFTDARVGAALVQTNNTPRFALWRTTDGGATWSTVPIR